MKPAQSCGERGCKDHCRWPACLPGQEAQAAPGWLEPLAARVREVRLPMAQLADAMRAHGEDPRDEELFRGRQAQLDVLLFGRALR